MSNFIVLFKEYLIFMRYHLRLINREAVYEKRKTRIYKYNMFKILIHSL